MKITFYGTRGSIPVPDSDFIQFGGNTSCVMLTLDDGPRITRIILYFLL
jgi:peptidoglycan/xylan/chitin deacetylase (PgdA/CDA1 family)